MGCCAGGPLGAAILMVVASVGCAAGGSETVQLPMQESGLVVDGELERASTQVAEYAVSEEELLEIEAACADAEGIPLEAGASCPTLIEGPPVPRPCTPLDICVHVLDTEGAELASAGYVEVVDGRQGDSLCSSAPGAVCLRFGLTEAALEEVAPSPTEPPSGEPPTGASDGSPTEATSEETPVSSSPASESPASSEATP